MTSAAPWIAEAIRAGFATEADGVVTLCPEYLETVGYNQRFGVLMLDFGSEAYWLQNAIAYKHDNNVVFDLGSGLGFILPLDASTVHDANHVVICHEGAPVTPPARLNAIPAYLAPQAISGAGFSSLPH